MLRKIIKSNIVYLQYQTYNSVLIKLIKKSRNCLHDKKIAKGEVRNGNDS